MNFNLTTVLSSFNGLVGMRPSSVVTIASGRQASSSGLFVSDLPNIDPVIIDKSKSTNYASLDAYLIVAEQAAISETIALWSSEGKEKIKIRELLANKNAAPTPINMTLKVTKNQRFVGYAINNMKGEGLKVNIHKLGLTLNNNATVAIYLYDLTKKALVSKTNINALSYTYTEATSTISLSKGRYLLGYYEENLTNTLTGQLTGANQAIDCTFDCGCANAPNKEYSKFINIFPVQFESTKLNFNGTDFDCPTADSFSIPSSTFGFNFTFSLACDVTTVLINNSNVFAKAVQLNYGIFLLQNCLQSNVLFPELESKKDRIKESLNNMKAQLKGFITADGEKHPGEIHNIVIDFSGLDKICLPCQNEASVIQYRR